MATIKLYHYTNHSGYQGIQESKNIKIASRNSHHGQGVYFNSRLVNHRVITKRTIAVENYRMGGDKNLSDGYVDYVVEVTFPKADVEEAVPSRHLWKFPTKDSLDLTKYPHSFRKV